MTNYESNVDLDQIREEELLKLDRLLEQYFVSACAGDHRASELFLQTSKRKSELLGLDALREARMEVVSYDQEELQKQYEFFKRTTNN